MTNPQNVPTLIEDKIFDQQLTPENLEGEPSTLLYQRPFFLSEADYLRLKKPSAILSGLAGILFTFAVTKALPLIEDLFEKSLEESLKNPGVNIYLILTCAGAGLFFLFLGYLLSSSKHSVLKRIKNHFKNNPAKPIG